jgi:hypothetical protein
VLCAPGPGRIGAVRERRPAVVSSRRLRFWVVGCQVDAGFVLVAPVARARTGFLGLALEVRGALGSASAVQRAYGAPPRLREPIGLRTHVPFGCDHRLSTVDDRGFLPLRGGGRPHRALTGDRCAASPARLRRAVGPSSTNRPRGIATLLDPYPPCLNAFRELAALPASVLGPVERAAFFRFAFSCASVAIILSRAHSHRQNTTVYEQTFAEVPSRGPPE